MHKWLWTLFALVLILFTFHFVGLLIGVTLTEFVIFQFLLVGLPVVLIFLHSLYVLGVFRGFAFMTLSAFIGWLMETLGLQYGVIFGGQYVYGIRGFSLGTVPLQVVLYWAVFIYIGYSLVNSFYLWKRRSLPKTASHQLALLILLIICDGLVVTFIDLFMDPLQVRQGSWTWLDGGPYFGVPIGNFIGWFLVAILSTGIYRVYEYCRPRRTSKIDTNTLIIPAAGYGLLALLFSLQAFQFGMYSLLCVGLLLMGPIVGANFTYFYRYILLTGNRATS